MNKTNLEEILNAARAAHGKTNVEHEQAFYGAWVKALSAELGLDPETGKPIGEAAPASSSTSS